MYMELNARLKQKLSAYSPSPQALEPIKTAPLVFLVGITGAGKNATLNRLMEQYPDTYHIIVSHTTRAPRENHGIMEQDGREYHFVTPEIMEQMLDNNEFIEAAPIHAHFSGSSIQEIKNAMTEGKIAINDIDIQGVDDYIGLGLNTKSIFMLPPNYDIWYERFITRYGGKVHHHDLVVRLQSAVKEIEHALKSDHFYIVINDDLEKTVELVNDIAHGAPVDPHYHKAVAIAEELLARIRQELQKML
jgi:guanylate kinase